MKETTSIKTKKVQIISEKEWNWIVEEGIQKRFKVRDLAPKILKDPPVITKPDELKATKKTKNE